MKILKSREKVQHLLATKPHLRDDDNKLIASVWFNELKEKGYSPNTMSGFDLLKEIADNKLTNPESIRRCRAKLQETNPKLRGKVYYERHKEKKIVEIDLRNFVV